MFLIPRFKTCLKLLAGLILALALLALGAWWFADDLLCVDSGPVTGDAIVVLGGGLLDRPERAAELFREKAAPWIIASGDGDCESNRQVMNARGVPAANILTECDSRNTMQNARHSVELLREHGAKNVIIVTSWFHSRRALACFRKAAPEMKFYSRPSYFAIDRALWKPKGIAGYIRREYVKLGWYWVRYGVRPI